MRNNNFKEHPTTPLWSARVDVMGLKPHEFHEVLRQTALGIGTFVDGYFLSHPNGGIRYQFSLFPERRPEIGVIPISQCEDTLKELRLRLNGTAKVSQPDYLEAIKSGAQFRVLLGLKVGESNNGNSETHRYDDVATALGGKANHQKAEIYSVGGARGLYTEPAILVTGKLDQLEHVYDAAQRFGQERFSVEKLVEEIAYIVETTHAPSRL
jgi:hypothetical protein